MGFDISYNPVDMNLIETRLLPYIQGEGQIDDLVERAVRLAATRFRANQWGLGLMSLKDSPETFDAGLHIWGRPFFITEQTPEKVSEAIDRYHHTDGDQQKVDELAMEMLELLEPGLSSRAQTSTSGTLPSEENLAYGFRWKMDLLREAWAARGTAQTISANGKTFEVENLLQRSLDHVLLDFSCQFQPGWMARGQVWPTALCFSAQVKTQQLIGTPAPMLGDLAQLYPSCLERLPATIEENYQVGGFTRAEDVTSLRHLFQNSRQKIMESPLAEDELEDFQLILTKLDEALADAERQGLAFCEASEIYSGPMGIMN